MGGFHDRMPLANTPWARECLFWAGAAIYGDGVQNSGSMPIAWGIDVNDLAALVRGLGIHP
jgi:hypothetical protein